MLRRKRKNDNRLLGTWKSDRRRTFKHFRPRPDCSPQSLRKFKSIFGKMVVRWDSDTCQTDLDGCKQTAAYEVIARDSVSVVVRCYDQLAQEARLLQIFFEGDHYWIWAGGNMREYFKRVDDSPHESVRSTRPRTRKPRRAE